ncbi:hypothetical protein J4772_11340 [Cohnella sp. LGH]|uniref:hypothetical protein n=1 Tax=Cohnella sp. LGH TaxID=1619153 RepID=UPI001ADAA289|nr:hypothetical protein [Cohnella sp. LGH]QTH44935.1 hypothetical protein J4772_11340 [Cohnella sp. LGH]
MAYTEFKALLKKINLKPKGVKEIVLEVSDGALYGKIDMLSEMLDGRVAIAVDSEVVRYNVQINTRTEKPIKSYRVDDQGVVSEYKPEGDQLEMDLDVAKKQDPIEEVPEEISREVVDDFILSGLAPRPEKHWYPIHEWVARLADGETYLKLANEAGISSGRVVDLVDEYRESVAPLAAKWDEWRKSKADKPASELEDDESDDLHENGEEDLAEGDEPGHLDGDSDDAAGELEDLDKKVETEDELSDWERQVLGEDPQNAGAEKQVDPADIESVILAERPVFEDIPYDFPALLMRRKGGETWMQIAGTLGIPSTKLSAAWSKYKKRVAEQQGGAA